MTTVLKKEWTISFWIILLAFLCIAIAGVGGVHPAQIPFLIGIFLFTYLFQVDENSKMNLRLASLPIDRKTIVRGRYLFLGLFVPTLIAVSYLFNQLTPFILKERAIFEDLSLTKSVLVLALFLFLISILLPIFYSFRYNVAALIAIFFVLPSIISLFVILGLETVLPLHQLSSNLFISKSALRTLGFSIFAYWVSSTISAAIFKNKDLHA